MKENRKLVSCDVAGYISGVNSDKITHIEEMHGYWTLSSDASDPVFAWHVYYGGDVTYDSVDLDADYSGAYGVRPVITLKI